MFVDTNVFIRLLARDDPNKVQHCLSLFQQVQRGQMQLFTSETIVAEVVYVLSSPSLYRLPRTDVVRLVKPLIQLRGLRIEHKRSLLRALDLYGSSNLDFEDCLSVEHIRRKKLPGIYSYDRGFDRVPGIPRLEP